MFDLTPLYRSTVGFDRLASLLESMAHAEGGNGSGYPPYNIERIGEDEYRITMAVAGFGPEDLDVEVKETSLTISANKTENQGENGQVLYRGIASRNFERRFQLADFVKVTGASLENGLLHIHLQRELPETMKPRTIEIQSAAEGKSDRTIEHKAA